MRGWCKAISEWRKQKGFVTPDSIATITGRNRMLGKLMLVVSEVAEAAEAVRADNRPGFEEEIADTVIRLFDICGTMGIDIDKEIAKKMEINKTRPTRHGKHTSL
jgi:NTP pyrophosphatase (non-canonical NTP hydrolase)